VLGLSLAAPALGAERPVAIPHGTVALLTEEESIQPGHSLHVGLHFLLEPGWHIYWVNPGDSGEPPRLEWRLPAGMYAGAIEWPAPRRLATPPLMDYGYEGEVLLPLRIENTAGLKAGEEANVAAELKAIVCREVCVPASAQLSLSLPVRHARPRAGPAITLFAKAKKALPKPAPASWRVSAKDLGDRFELRVDTGRAPAASSPAAGAGLNPTRLAGAWFAPLMPQQLENAAPQKTVTKSADLRLVLKKSQQLLRPLSRLRGVLVLPSQGAFLIDAPVESKQ